MEINIKNNQRLIKINCQKIEHTLKKVIKHLIYNYPKRYGFLKSIELSIVFVNDRKIRELNLKYRGKDKTTDVLSFPQIELKSYGVKELRSLKDRKEKVNSSTHQLLNPLTHLGDIVINLHKAKRQAKEHELTFYNEVLWLLVHGLLHLLGHDHEINKYQARKMRQMERELLSIFSFKLRNRSF